MARPVALSFLVLPLPDAAAIREAARAVSYGWGMAPIEGAIGEIAFTTALFPKDGTYFLPLKDAVRRQADITFGDRLAVELRVRGKRGRGGASLPI